MKIILGNLTKQRRGMTTDVINAVVRQKKSSKIYRETRASNLPSNS
ncbi:MAG TPA: hypothetical protein VGP58_08030 [Pyrinomonadaceae bacterium]|nr:hypothetical protein [Pyrinomonadaceae bacterium]